MTGAKNLLLLLLAAHALLGGCQSNTVSMYPSLSQIYSGDLFYLDCNSNVGEVKWFHNNNFKSKGTTLRIPAAASKDSGTYHCETSGASDQKMISINVLDYYPTASLSLLTGQPVVMPGDSVTLRLHNEEGLQGWRCSVLRGKETKRIVLNLKNKSVNFLDFQTNRLLTLETIFMCTNRNGSQRSNQVTIRTSNKDVTLEMYFAPGIIGEAVTLRCLNWNADEISHVVFYKNDKYLVSSTRPIHRISSVGEEDQGTYKCDATIGSINRHSDAQELFVQGPAMRAAVSGISELLCSCPHCPSGITYIWFKITEGNRPERLPGNSQGLMNPEESGTYACMAIWGSGRTLISKSYFFIPMKIIIVIIVAVIILMIIVAAGLVVTFKKKRRRNDTGPLYEDVKLQSKEDRYERLQKRGGQKESEYDIIHPAEPEGVKKEGDYQPLEKAGMANQVYHTVGMKEGECSAAPGGYEPLNRQTEKEDIYHTIGMEGAAGEGQQ